MMLSHESIDWIERTTNILKSTSHRHAYIALEGLPCAGKTSTINSLRKHAYCTVDEVRLPPSEETCLAYLSQEPFRTQRIQNNGSPKQIIGDRCIISTLAHKASLLTYFDAVNFEKEVAYLNDLTGEGKIILPEIIISLDISIDTSMQRQEIRDRDKLEGRLWYDSRFLDIIATSTNMIIGKMYARSSSWYVDSEKQSLNGVLEQIKNMMRNKYGKTYSEFS